MLKVCSRTLATMAARDPRFSLLTDADLGAFERIIGRGNVVTDDLQPYNTDWQNWYQGQSRCALLPTSTEEVSAILRHCSQRKLAVVPQAGNTGLVGGSIPIHDEVIVSIKKIRNEFKFDEVLGILECDAGFVLQEIGDKISPYGFMMPYSLGAKGSCLLGGNIATCAGGIHLMRYGSLHAHLLGLTAVIPDEQGTVLKLGAALRKDNTSFHLPHLFLGSEGQLGIVTKVCMTTVRKSENVFVSLVGLESFDKCIDLLKFARAKLGDKLCAFEFMDSETIECVEANLPLKSPLSNSSRHYVLMEISDETTAGDVAQKFVLDTMEEGFTIDGVVSNSVSEAEAMWHIRESATLSLAKDGYVYKHDVSLPLEHFYSLTEAVRERCGPLAQRIVTYGHLGDGNSHLNVTSKEFSQELYDSLYPFVYEFVTSCEGSISAEHGIGQMKLPYVGLNRSPEEQKMIKKIKKAFDPNGILNPYKFL